jgi:hypothetical protein
VTGTIERRGEFLRQVKSLGLVLVRLDMELE